MRLTLEAYDGTTRVKDPYQLLPLYTNLQYDTGYPGGLFLRCSFRLPIAAPRRLTLQQGNVLKVKSGGSTVWEGVVQSIVWHDAIDVSCIGWWGHLLMRRVWHKYWADSRLTEDAWAYTTTASAAEKCFVDRNDRLRFTPKAEAWTTSQIAQLRYDAPTGTNIARIEYDYDMAENSPTTEWSIVIRDIDNTSSVVTVSATGSASGQSHDFSPVTTAVGLWLQANGNQTPPSDGTEYGEFSNVTIFAEWEGATPTAAEGTVTMYQLCLDALDKYSGELSASLAFLDSGLSVAIEPFIAQYAEDAASILMRAAQYGDTAGLPIAVGIRESDKTSDSLPPLYAETYAQTTDHEYILNWQAANRVGGSMAESITDLANYIYVEYTDETGKRKVVGPADDATLTNAVSSATWGQIDKTIRSQETTQANAIKAGVRYLAHFKDPQWYMSRPVQVEGYIESKRRTRVPVAHVRAGERIKIQDFAGTDKVMVITHARYDAEQDIVSITAGRPPFLLDGRLIK